MKHPQRFEDAETPSSLPPKRYFTLEQAQQFLPKIEEHLLEMRKLAGALQLLLTVELDFEDPFLSHVKDIRYTKEFHKLSVALYTHADAIASLGCFLKDGDQGLVDFYAKKDGRDIFLCWKFGEPRIAYWHEIDTGFTERRGIEEL